MTKRFERQLGIVKYKELKTPITIVGVGSVGSWSALLLAKMGCSNIKVIDFDKVENHNVASQYYSEKQIGMYKVDALKESVLEQTGIEIETSTNTLDEEVVTDGIVIPSVDSMERRIELGEIYKNRNILILDTRQGGLEFEIYIEEAVNYQKTLVNPEHIQDTPCTERAICFNGAVVGGFVANLIRRELANGGEEKVRGELNFNFNNLTLLKDIK